MISPPLVGLIGLGILFLLIALGFPVAISMIMVGIGGFAYLASFNSAIAKLFSVPFDTVTDVNFAVLPLFLLMANIIANAGFATDLFELASKWLGRLRGGLALGTIAACAVFAAASASSLATAVAIGLIAIPAMKKYGYDPGLSSGSVACGGTLGSLIPPSALMVLYATITETSIGKLFVAGIIPGVLEAIFYMITILVICRFRPHLGPATSPTTWKEKLAAIPRCTDIIILIALVLGGLYLGWFSPTEAGAVGALGALLLSLIRKRLTWQGLKNALLTTLRTTGMIYFLVIGAHFLNPFVALSRLPMMLTDWISMLPISPMGTMAIIIAVYIMLGCVFDALALILLTLPLFFPLVMTLGFDPIWFGIIVVRMVEIAVITPPIGMNLFALGGLFPDVPPATVFRGVIPFVIADIFHVALLLLVPQVVLFLPQSMS